MKSMPKEVQQALKEMMEKIKAKGMNVEARAFRIGENGLEPIQAEDKVGDMLSQLGLKTQEQQAEEGPCFCPNCFNYEKFEETLGQTGTFDYKSITFDNGKQFNIKYYEGKFGEHVMMQPVETTPKLSKDELKKQFEDAVKAKDYDKAQILLAEIQNLKTNN